MKILVVEDEPKTGNYLKQGLTEAGFVVDLVRDGNDGLHAAVTENYDLIVLDVMLPGRDGWSVLRALREAGNSTPVLFLTARDQVDDRVKGLELGADDYLVKPFAFSELLARVRTLLRRGKTKEPEVLRVADMELDLYRRRVMRSGKRIDLTAKEFALLELLLRRHDEVLPRSLIASQVWDMNFDSDTNVIEVAVRRLRAKIDDGFEPKLIQTVQGDGLCSRDAGVRLMWRKSITFRLALYFGGASTAVLLAIGYLVGISVERHFLELDHADLHGKMELVRHVLAKVRIAGRRRGAAGTDGRRVDRPRQPVRQHHRARRKDAVRHGRRRLSRAAHRGRSRRGADRRCPSWCRGSTTGRSTMASRPGSRPMLPELPQVVVAVALDFAAHHAFMAASTRFSGSRSPPGSFPRRCSAGSPPGEAWRPSAR